MGKTSRNTSKQLVSGKHKVAPYQIIRFLVHEFGFGLLLLSFTLGAMSLGVSVQYFSQVKSLDDRIRATELEVCPKLPAPSGVVARSGQYEGELMISWNSVERATGYVLRVESQANQAESVVVPVRVESNEMSVRGLNSGELYKVTLATDSSCGVGIESGVIMGLARVGGSDSGQAAGSAQDEGEEIAAVSSGVNVSGLKGIGVARMMPEIEGFDWEGAIRYAMYERGVWFMIGAIFLFLNAAWLAFYSLWGMGRGAKWMGGSVMGMRG